MRSHVTTSDNSRQRPPWTGAKYVRAGKIIAAKVKNPREPRLQELLQSWYFILLDAEPEALGIGDTLGAGRVVCAGKDNTAST